jgi:hypothetical protein
VGVGDAAVWLQTLGGLLLQQQRQDSEGPTVCFVLIAPFLLGAAVVGVRSFQRTVRRFIG